jgi:hypothetical protein
MSECVEKGRQDASVKGLIEARVLASDEIAQRECRCLDY